MAFRLEVVRNPQFFDRLRRDEQILAAGPRLYRGDFVYFKTLNIQKRKTIRKGVDWSIES